MNRIELTYPRVGFQRPLIYFGVAVACLAANLLFGKPQDEYVSGQHLTGISLFQLVTGVAAFFCFVSTIWDAGFVLRVRDFLHRITFDEQALYIDKKGIEQSIPLRDILSLRLTGMGGNGIRGTARVYEVRFQSNGLEDSLLIAIYTRNMGALDTFEKTLERENPAAEIKNYWTSLDGLFRLFRRPKD